MPPPPPPFDPAQVKTAEWRKISDTYNLSEYPEPEECAHCQKRDAKALKKCSGCLKVSYCGAEHQRLHWRKRHKHECCPFKIENSGNDVVGRYVVATRDIHPGEVILSEKPAAAGPKQFTAPSCLGCYSQNVVRFNEENKSYEFASCSQCGWPVCSKECERAPAHLAECEYLKGCKYKPRPNQEKPSLELPIFECLAPLRCILAKKLAPESWKVMTLMEQHTDLRRKEACYEVNRTNTVDFIMKHIPLDFEVTPEEIETAINVLDVNAFEIRTTDYSIRGVYPLTAMMNSSCCPNTQNCIADDYTCRVRAARHIKKGEEVLATYTVTLAGTQFRRKHLRESKYFECRCTRCKDPTELGSHFSSLLCPTEDCGGLVTMKDPLDPGSDWRCQRCQREMKGSDVDVIVAGLEQEAEEMQKQDCTTTDESSLRDSMESLLSKMCGFLHPNHAAAVDLKFSLAQLYGRSKAPDGKLIQEGRRKQRICLEILDVMDLVIPGMFRLRGMFLFELYVVSLFLLKRDPANEAMPREERLFRLQRYREDLQESVEILSWEPVGSAEGRRCLVAREYLKSLDAMIEQLKQVAQSASSGISDQPQKGRKSRAKVKQK